MAINVRTAEELQKPEYNYFIALKLNGKEKNTTVIEKAISKTCGNTSGDIISRRLIELRQDITEIMVNDAVYDPSTGTYKPNSGGRQKEAEAAKQLKLSELMKLIQNMCMSNGRIFKSTLVELCTTANKTAEYFTIDELIKQCDSLIRQGVKFIDNTTALIPFGDLEKASKLLETPPAKANLYEFLGIPEQSSSAEIAAARQKVYNESQTKTDLKLKQSVSNLCALVDTLLIKNDSVRRQYDYYMRVKDTVWDQFKMRKTYGAKGISIDEYYTFAETLQRTLGLKIDDVEEMLGAGLKYYGLVVAGEDGDGSAKDKLGIPDLEICPYPNCGQIYRAGAKSCPHCNKPLEVICWNCGSTVPYTSKNKTCSSCGVAHESKERFEAACAEIDSLIRQSSCDIGRLRTALVNLKNLAPGDKGGRSEVAKKAAYCEKIISDKMKEEETTGEKYRADEKNVREQIAQRNYLTALSLVNNMRRSYPSYNADNTNKLASSIQAVVTQAQGLFENAKRFAAQSNEAMFIDNVAKVLEICADHLEAKQFIRKYPPAAPTTPKIFVSEDGKVHLEWSKAGNQKLVTYKIIKKIGSRPQNVKDGTVIDENLEINFYEDANITSATPYYYAVCAVRCEVESAMLAFPDMVQVFGNVTNINQEVVPGKISIHWDAPQNFASIDVWKKEGTVAPLKPGDGVKINGTKEGFVDDDCAANNSYLIVCSYKTADGIQYSKAITRTFKKYDIIKKLENVVVTQNTDSEFCLTCSNPSNEKIRIIYSQNKLPCRTDVVLQMNDYNACFKDGSVLSVFYDSENKTCFNIPKNSIGYIYVVVYNDQLFCAAPPVVVNTIAGITAISYEEQSGGVKIKGNLNPASKRVIAKISEKAFAKTIDSDGEQIAITREQFESDGGFIVKLKSNASHYITIFSELNLNGKMTVSCPMPLGEVIDMREKVAVDYCLEYTVSATSKFKVTVKFAAADSVQLPDMVLMKGSPIPMNKSSGTLAERIPGVTLKKGLFSSRYTAKVTITLPPDRMNMKFKLFFADEHVKQAKLREVRSI